MAFEWPLRVYWEDTDAGGIVFYANYLKFFERARTEWLRARGIGQQALREQTGGMFVVSETSLKYHRPARLDDELVITAQLEQAGRAGLTLVQTALRQNAATSQSDLLCEGRIRIAWVCAQTLKPERIPAQVLEKLA